MRLEIIRQMQADENIMQVRKAVYLQSEPFLQCPSVVQSYVKTGDVVPAFIPFFLLRKTSMLDMPA